MSFGINGPSPKFGIQEAQNMRNNGGGGNLGYFQRGKKKKNKDDKEEVDMFESSKDENSELLMENDNYEVEIFKKASEFIKMFKKRKTT